MKTLTEHNADCLEVHEDIRKMQEPHKNGIACPECGKELWDSNPSITFASNPPQKGVHCPGCGYRGYRLE